MLLKGCCPGHAYTSELDLGSCWVFGLLQKKTCGLYQQSMSLANHWRPWGKIPPDASVSKPTTVCQVPFWAATSWTRRSSSYPSPMLIILLWLDPSPLLWIWGGAGLRRCSEAWMNLEVLAPPFCRCRHRFTPLSFFCHCLCAQWESGLRLWSTLPDSGLKHWDGRWPQFPIHLWWVWRVVFGIGSLIQFCFWDVRMVLFFIICTFVDCEALHSNCLSLFSKTSKLQWKDQRLCCRVIDPNKSTLSFCLSAPSLHLSWKCTSISLNSFIHHDSGVDLNVVSLCNFQPSPIPSSCRCQCLLALGKKIKISLKSLTAQ